MSEKAQKKSIYIESSVISYLTAKENPTKSLSTYRPDIVDAGPIPFPARSGRGPDTDMGNVVWY